METVEQIQKAFREARITGEKMLNAGKITWEQYAFTMLGYEAKLRQMGVDL